MKNLVAIIVLAFAQVALGQMPEDSIHSIVNGSPGEPHLIKYSSGRVEFVEPSEKSKLAAFQKSLTSQHKSFAPDPMLLEEDNYQPKAVSEDEIPKIFKRMNIQMRRRSECSDRAHVWAFDEFQRSGTKSEKAFLFLTDTYIKRHRYKWWFHVAPLYTTTSGEKMLMDAQFLDRPVKLNAWKNLLVFSKRECVKDFRYLDYDAGADQTQDCYMKNVSMYYRLPADIGAMENGMTKSAWNNFEISSARSRAFTQGNN